jgi:hypothetical protein
LQVHVHKYTKLWKLQIESAFLHIYKFAHAKFTCFHTCYQSMTKLASLHICKFTSFQVCKIICFTDYTVIITILQFHKLQLHACKYEKLPNYQITKLQITNYKIYNYQNYKFCKCIFAYLQVNARAQFACF